MTIEQDNLSNRTKFYLVCGVMIVAVFTASWSISEKTLSNHECMVSITAREMLQEGNWVVPTCNGLPRLQKTPLSYWLVAGIAAITGSVNEVTARMPSVIFAVLSVVAMIYYVKQWLSFRIAIISSLVWATSLGYIRYSHNARPEMVLTFFITLCFFSFYSAINAKTRKKQIIQAMIFWVSFGLGNIAKGPAPLPLVMVPLFFYVLVFRQWKVIPKLLPIVGVIILLAIALPWPIAVAYKMNWDMSLWKHEFVDRFFGTYASGDKNWYYYLLRMFQFSAPWSAFLAAALPAPFYKVWGKKRPTMFFLWLWFIADLAFLTLNGGKRQHYIMPIMPAMAILIGILFEDMVFTRKAYSKIFAKKFLTGHLFVLIIGAIALPVYFAKINTQFLPQAAVLGATIAVVAALIAIFFANRKEILACTMVFVGFCVIQIPLYAYFINPMDYNRYSRDFSRKIANIVPQTDKLVAFEYISDRSVHYFGIPISEINDMAAIYEYYQEGNWVVATAGHLDKIDQDGRFRQVYYKQKAERRKHMNAPGALFHKSAPLVGNEP